MKCANSSCGKEFEKRTHNNIYCSPECCKIATNRKIMERYYKKKALAGSERVCSSESCTNALSKYNKTDMCAECESQKRAANMNQIKAMFSAY